MQDLTGLPFGSEYNPPERILCAANKVVFTRYGDVERVIPCVRHGDDLYFSLIYSFDHTMSPTDIDEGYGDVIEGFLTSKHRFVNRNEAWNIAVENNQIVRRVGNDTKDGGTLYSENLY